MESPRRTNRCQRTSVLWKHVRCNGATNRLDRTPQASFQTNRRHAPSYLDAINQTPTRIPKLLTEGLVTRSKTERLAHDHNGKRRLSLAYRRTNQGSRRGPWYFGGADAWSSQTAGKVLGTWQ